MNSAPVCLIVNPRSGAGRTGRNLERLKTLAQRAGGEVQLRLTSGPGDGIRQAEAAARAGAARVIAVGGDGTANEVVNGIVQSGRRDIIFSIVPAGTGSDLVKTLKMPTSWERAVPLAVSGAFRPCDLMEGRFTQADGSVNRRYGINLIGMGMAGEVVRRVNRGSKALGGTLTFFSATIGALFQWSSPEVLLEWKGPDGQAGRWQGRIVNAFVGNGQYCGGGMWIGPAGRIDDGVFELVVVPHMSLARLLVSTPRLYDGRISEVEGALSVGVRSLRASSVTAGAVLSDIDGEQPGMLPVEIECVQGCLSIVDASV